MSGFGYIDFVSIWNKQISRYSMIWIGKNNDMKDMYIRKLFFQLEKPSPTSREAFVLHDREERGYSSNHDERSWWWFLMVMIVRIFYHKKDEEALLCWYWWLVALGKHDIVHTYIFGLISRWRCPSFWWPSKKCSTPKKMQLTFPLVAFPPLHFPF